MNYKLTLGLAVRCREVKKKQYTLGLTADKTELKLAETLRGMCLKSGVVDRDQLEDGDGGASCVSLFRVLGQGETWRWWISPKKSMDPWI